MGTAVKINAFWLFVVLMFGAGLGLSVYSVNNPAKCEHLPEKARFYRMIEEINVKAYLQERHPETALCRNMEKPVIYEEPQVWQDVENRKVKVFSAFFEERTQADGPAIRIIGIGWQAAFKDILNLYCNFWYEDLDYALSTGPAIYNVIYPSTAHPEMWCSHFIICKLPSFPGELKLRIPQYVSLGPEPCHTPTNKLLVLNREPVPVRGSLGLCVSPMYNKFKNWTMVIEMYEMYKILGAEEITTYNFSVSVETENTLKYYKENDNFNLVQWKFPRLLCNVFGQRGALNDCLYRMGHKYQYVIVVDLDELIVPRSTADIPLLLEYISEPHYGSYLFQHAYFKRNYDALATADPYLITMTSFTRTDKCVPGGRVRSKPIFDKDRTVSIDLHTAYKLLPGYSELVVPEQEGFLHHYRSYPMESFQKKPHDYTFIEDKHMLKYREKLEKAYLHVVRGVTNKCKR